MSTPTERRYRREARYSKQLRASGANITGRDGADTLTGNDRSFPQWMKKRQQESGKYSRRQGVSVSALVIEVNARVSNFIRSGSRNRKEENVEKSKRPADYPIELRWRRSAVRRG